MSDKKKVTTAIQIADDFALPIDLITWTQIILGKKGKGKSYKAAVQCEEMLERGAQIVVLDPTGSAWGLRSSADGKSVGYPITIFGGKHADVPLESTAGEVIADAIIADGFSAIVDLSSFTKGEEQRFCAAFLETLYRKNEKPIHLFLDEADVFAPQRPFGEEMRTLGACQSIVRRGRIKGIGCTMITQRPQVLNKDVLSQADVLTVLGMNHPKDIGAIDEWVAVHGDPKLAKEMMASLPSLPRGEAWVWAPANDIFRRVTYRDRRTFDSGRTPKAGEKVSAPKVLAHVDLERLGETIKATVERAKANDPKALKARVADLERQLGDRQPTLSQAQHSDIIHAFGDFTQKVEHLMVASKQMEAVERNLGALLRGAIQVNTGATVKGLARRADALGLELDVSMTRQRGDAFKRPVPKDGPPPPGRIKLTRAGGYDPKLGPKHPDNYDPTLEHPGKLPPGEVAILSALIQFERGLRNEQLTVLCGYKRSSRNSYVKRLISKGYAERSGDAIIATSAGIAALPNYAALPMGAALRRHWESKLPEGERVMFDQLCAAYPATVPPAELGESAGYKRSSRNSYVKRLVAKELAVRSSDGIRAADTLFGVE